MNQISNDRLAELTTDALERTAFVLVDPADDDAIVTFTPTRCSRLALAGDTWSGAITLGADDDFLREVAASLLGIDEDDVDVTEHGEDVLRELANIIAGSVSLELGGDKVHIQMGLPEIVDTDTPTAESSALLEGDSGFLNVWWTFQDKMKAAA